MRGCFVRSSSFTSLDVALSSVFVPKEGEGKSLQFRRATGSIPFNRGHTCLCSRHHVKEQRLFFKIIYFIERQIKQHQYYKLCATRVLMEGVHHLSCVNRYSATSSNLFPATIKSKCVSRINECYLSTSSQKKTESLTNGKTFIPRSYPVKSQTEHLTGPRAKAFFPVLASAVQAEVGVVGGHVQVDAAGQLWPDAAGGGGDALPAVHGDVGQQLLPLLLRGAALVGLQGTEGTRHHTCIHC